MIGEAFLYPQNGVVKVVDPHAKTHSWELHTDDGVEKISEERALALIEADRAAFREDAAGGSV